MTSDLTILMPLKGSGDAAMQSILSVLRQQSDFSKFIIVDDGIESSILEFLDKLDTNKLEIIKSVVPGVAQALNLGLDHVKTRFVARADGDDLNINNRFRMQVQLIQNHGAGILAGSALKIDEKNRIIGYIGGKNLDSRMINEILIWRNPIIHPTVLLDLKEIPNFRYPILKIEDYAAWIRMRNRTTMIIDKRAVICYRVHKSNVSKTFNDKDLREIRSNFLKQVTKIENSESGQSVLYYDKFSINQNKFDLEIGRIIRLIFKLNYLKNSEKLSLALDACLFKIDKKPKNSRNRYYKILLYSIQYENFFKICQIIKHKLRKSVSKSFKN